MLTFLSYNSCFISAIILTSLSYLVGFIYPPIFQLSSLLLVLLMDLSSGNEKIINNYRPKMYKIYLYKQE